jgi:hypothetical protein
MKINFYLGKMMLPKTADLVMGNCKPLAKKIKILELITAVNLQQKQMYDTYKKTNNTNLILKCLVNKLNYFLAY